MGLRDNQRQHSTDQCEGNRSKNEQRVFEGVERGIEQKENKGQTHRHDLHQPLLFLLELIILPSPFHTIPIRQPYLSG